MNLRKSISLLLLLCGVGCLQPTLLFAQPLDVIWDRSGNDPDSHFGISLYPLGDQNDDGFADWMVWSQAGDVGAESESIAQFFHGGNPPASEPYLTIIAPRNSLELAYSRSVGDLNGDGHVDWFNGIKYENNTVYSHEVFWGGPDYDEVPDLVFTSYNYTIRNEGHEFDFNGDGFGDLYLYNFTDDIGRVMYGSESMDSIPDWELQTPTGVIRQSLPTSFGDLNNDGFDDFVSVDRNIPVVWIFAGSPQPDDHPAVTLDGIEALARVIVNDLNDDGFDDLILLDMNGIWSVYRGNPTLDMAPSFEFEVPGCIIQPQLYCARDFNNDGYNDFMVVDYACNQGWGMFYMFMGTHWHEVPHAFTILGRGDYDLAGIRNALGPGDINGDGVDDIIIGATNNDDEGRRGRAVALAGSDEYQVPAVEPPSSVPHTLDLSVYPNPFNAQTTIEFDIPPGSSRIEIAVFNTLGQRVHSENLPALGTRMRYFFNAFDLSTGIYFLRVNTSTAHATKKLLVLK